DEHLRRASIGNGKSEGDGPTQIGFNAWVVRKGPLAPQARYLWITVDAELSPASPDYPKEAATIVIPGANKIIKTIRATRRPIAVDFDHQVAPAGFQAHIKPLRRALVQLRCIGIVEQGRERSAFGCSAGIQKCRREHKSEFQPRFHSKGAT